MSAQPEAGPRPYRFTVDKFERACRSGLFGEAPRVQLLDGEFFKRPEAEPPHDTVVHRLYRRFVQHLGDRAIVCAQHPVRLRPYSEPWPDIAVLGARDGFSINLPPEGSGIHLVIEVCDSSLEFDRQIKLPVYAHAGLPQVWLIDLDKQTVLAHRDPVDGVYANNTELHRDANITTGPPLDMELRVSSILR